ncbi:MAG: hypothetical protein JOY59_04215 [Candidatus Eremiobacteraeota bacterium]|nr:hypothetical protein [Candidatus Eremiobacteraeota bacterium]
MTALLNGSGGAQGLGAQTIAETQDANDFRTMQATIQAELAKAQKDLSTSPIKGDAALTATQQKIIARLKAALATNKQLVSSAPNVIRATQQATVALQKQSAAQHCTAVAAVPATPPAQRPGSVAAGGCRGFIGRWRTETGKILDINWVEAQMNQPPNLSQLRGSIGGSATTFPDMLMNGTASGNTMLGQMTFLPSQNRNNYQVTLSADGRSFSGQQIASNGTAVALTGTCLGPPGGTFVGAGTLDLSGNWTLHITSGSLYYDHSSVLSGPAGGPWAVAMTLRATNDPNWTSRIGNRDTDCTLFPIGTVLRATGPAGSAVTAASIVHVPGLRYDCQGVENGSSYHRDNDGALINGKIVGSGWEFSR